MKKFLMVVSFSLMLVLLVGTYAMAASTITVGYDTGGKAEGKSAGVSLGKADASSAISLGYEYTVVNDALEYGGGIEYQLDKSAKDNTAIKFNFIPLYGLINYSFPAGNVQPYVTGRLGYNLFNGNDNFTNGASLSGGLYYAVGFGVNVKPMKIALLYSVNNGSTSQSGKTGDYTYTATSLVLGYTF